MFRVGLKCTLRGLRCTLRGLRCTLWGPANSVGYPLSWIYLGTDSELESLSHFYRQCLHRHRHGCCFFQTTKFVWLPAIESWWIIKHCNANCQQRHFLLLQQFHNNDKTNKTIPYLFIYITSILIHNLSWQGMFWRCLQNPNIDVMFVLIGY